MLATAAAGAASLLLSLLICQWLLAWLVRRLLRLVCWSVENVQLSLWQGRLSLHKVHLHQSLFDALDLPLVCNSALIQSVEVVFPWKSCGTQPATLVASGLRVHMGLRVLPKARDPSSESYDAARKESLRRSLLQSLEVVMAGKASPITQSVWKSAAWSACNLAVLGLASGTYLSISDVLLALELGSHDLAGAVAGLAEGGGEGMPRLEVQVGSLQWHRQCSSLSRRRLDGSFSLEGVLCAVCVSTDSRGGASHSSATGLEATDLKRIVLRRWNCRMRMQWSPLGDEGTRQPWLALSIQAGPVLLAADRFVIGLALAASKRLSDYLRFAQDRARRPLVSVSTSPGLWWRHAIRRVLHYLKLRSIRGDPRRVWEKDEANQRERCRHRVRYKAALLLQLRQPPPRRAWPLAAWVTPQAAWRRLAHMESNMTVDDIVACRWWSLVWHEAMKPGKASAPSPHLVRSLSSELTHQHLQQHANRLATWVAVSIDAMCPKFELGLEHTTREPMLLASFGNHNLQCRLDPRGVRSATLKASIASFAVLGFSQRGWEHGQGALETPTELIRAPVDGAETGWMQIWLDSGRNSQGTSATDGPACHIDLSPANAYCALSRLLPVAEFASGLMGHAPLRRFLSKHLPGMAKQLRYSGDGLAGGAMSSAMDFRVRLQGLSVLVPCGHSWHSSGHRREAAGSLAISFTDVTLARMDPTVDCRSVGGRSGLSGAAANGVAEEDEGEEASPSPTAPGIGLWMRKMCGARSFKRLTAESTVESWLTCGAPSESIPVLEPLHVRLELQTATAAGNPISSASKQPGYLPLRQRLVHASASTGDIKVYISPFLAYSLVSISKETSDLVRGLQHLGAASPSSQGAQAMPRMPAQLSIQASVPRLIASVIRKEKSSAAEGLEKEGLFCIALTNSSVSLASDSLGSELRFSVEQTSVVMAGASKLGKGTTTSLLTPIPPMVLALFASKRWRLKRSFFAWRSASSHDKPIGSQVGIVRRLVQHRLVSCHNGQVSGSLSLDWAARHVQVVADTSPLITNLDTKMVTHMESFAAALCQLIEQEAAASANHVAGREEAASGSTVNQMPKALPPGGGLSLSLMVRLASVHSVAQSSGIRIFSASVEDPLLTVVAAPNPVGQPGEGQRDVTARLTAHSLCVRDLLCPNPWFSKVISDNSENTESTSPGRPGAQVSIWLETTWARPAVTLRQTPLEQGCSVPSSRRTSAENLSSSSRQHPPGSSPPVCRWVVRINLEHARLVALSRFAADTGYFLHSFVEALRRLQAAAASVSTVHSPSGSDPGSRDSWGSEAPPPAARPSSVSFQLTVLGLTVDLPRNSLAHEYYTVAVGSAEVMLPVSSSSMSNYRQSQLNAAPENGGEATGRCGQTAPGRRADRGRPFDLSTDKLPSTRSNPPGGRNGPHAKDRIKGQYKASSAPSSPANIGRCSSQGRRISRLVASAGNSSSMEGKPFEEVLEYKDRWAACYPTHTPRIHNHLHGVRIADMPTPFLSAFCKTPDPAEPSGCAVELHGRIAIFWTFSVGKEGSVAVRKVAEGDSITLGIFPDHQSTMHVKVVFAEASWVYGGLQHSLLMATMLENLYEAPMVGPSKPSYYGPPGTPYPQAPPLPGRLGISPTARPAWEIEVMMRSVCGTAESYPESGNAEESCGLGPSLAQIQGSNVTVKVQGHRDQAIRVKLMSASITLSDMKRQPPGFPRDKTIIRVDGENPRVRPGLSNSAFSRWNDVCHLLSRSGRIISNAEQAEGNSLPADHSVIWRPPQEVLSCLTSNGSHVGQEDFDDRSSIESDAVMSDDEGNSTMQTCQHDPQRASQAGFQVEYVLQPGAHVLEVSFHGASLHWPYAKSLEMVWAIVDVYTRHFFQPTCAVHPPAPGLSQWFFVNVVFHHSELHLPLLRHPDEAPMAEHKKTSLLVNIPVLRVGYSWGGNGEALLGCDMRNVEAMSQAHSASGKQAGEKELLKPCSVKFNTFWNNPVDRELRTSTVTMSSTPIQLKVAFSQMPLLQDAASLFISKKQDDPHMVAETQDGLASSVPPSDATPSLGKTKSASPRQESRLRPAEASKKQSTSTRVSQDTAQTPQPSSLLKAVVTVDSCAIILVDDRNNLNIDVLEASLHNLAANLGSEHVELEHGTSESEAAASISVELQVQFLNSAVDMMEPMVDRWPVTFELRSSGGATSMMLSSPQRLTVHVTPAAFRSVGDLLAFYQSFTEQARNADRLANAAPGSRTSACDASDGSVPMDQVQSSLYILRNRSGIRLSYWAHLGGNSHSLGHGEDSPLMVAPELHIVSLPESGQTIRARTICMQLEGAWTSLTSVIVDKVGVYGYEVDSHFLKDGGKMPVVMTVEPSARSKILTVHSPFFVLNQTPHTIEHVFRMNPGLLRATTNSSLSAPLPITLMPNQGHYLPVSAGAGGHLKVRAIGYQAADMDVIRVGLDDQVRLQEQQGIITCKPIQEEDTAFHCCLELKKQNIQMFCSSHRPKQTRKSSKPRSTLLQSIGSLAYHTLALVPPIVLDNLLPYHMTVSVFEVHQPEAATLYDIGPGSTAAIHCFDMEHKIRMTVSMVAPFGASSVKYSSENPTTIHYPGGGFIDRRRRKDALKEGHRRLPGLANLPDLRLPRDFRMSPVAETGPHSRRPSVSSMPQGPSAAHQECSPGMPFMNNPRGHNIQTPAKRHSALFPTTFGRNLSIPSLLLALSNKLNPASGSRRITIHCPYWIVNASSLPIQLKDGTPQLPTLVPEFQGDSHAIMPVLLGTDKNSITMSINPGTAWSRSILLDSVGIKGAISLMEELKPESNQLKDDVSSPGSSSSRLSEEQRLEVGPGRHDDLDWSAELVPRRLAIHGRPRMPRLANARFRVLKASKSLAHWRIPTSGSSAASFASGPVAVSDVEDDGQLPSSASLQQHEMLADEPETELEIDRLPSVATDSTSNRYTVPAMALNPFRRKSAKLFVPARVFQRFEFVVDIKVAPSLFHMTHIVTISERFLLFNNTRSSIQVGQIGTPGTLLRPSVHIPFHWKDADGVQELRIKPCQPPGELASVTWGWSGSFRIDEVGEIGVLVRGLYNPKMVKIININISLEDATVLIAFSESEEQSAPYRIENRSERVVIEFMQRDLDHDDTAFEALQPTESMRYAWEEPTLLHKLRVRFRRVGSDNLAAIREYSLDDIKTHRPVLLARADDVVQRKKAGPGGRRRDSVDLASDSIYAAVVADGPTRVLYFSDTRDAFALETEEERFQALSEKLKALDLQVADVDRQLDDLTHLLLEQRGLSLGLALAHSYPALAEQQLADKFALEAETHLKGSGPGHARSFSTPHFVFGVRSPGKTMSPTRLEQDSPAYRPGEGRDHLETQEAVSPDSWLPSRLLQIGKDAHGQEAAGNAGEATSSRPVAVPSRPANRLGSAFNLFHRRSGSTATAVDEPPPENRRRDSILGGCVGMPSTSNCLSPSTFERMDSIADDPSDMPNERQSCTLASQTLADSGRRSSVWLSGKRSSLRTVTFDSDASQGVDAAAPGDNSKVWTSGPLFRTLSDSRVSSTSIDGLTLPTAGDGWLDLGFQRAALMGSVGQAEGGIARTISAPPLQASAELEIQELDDYMDKEAILGGELVIRIYGAENIAAVGRWKTIVRKSLTIRDCTERNDRPAERAETCSSGLRETSAASAAADTGGHAGNPQAAIPDQNSPDVKSAANKWFKAAELETYVVLECQDQVKRTSVAGKSSNPVWNEDITFKSVQVESVLKITVYGKNNMFRSDFFLGEVIIPLSELQAVDSLEEVQVYDLSRRSRERFSGRIKLGSMWKITPLDVVTLKIKARQTELDDKEEVVALLQDRFNIQLEHKLVNSKLLPSSQRLADSADPGSPENQMDWASSKAASSRGGNHHLLALSAPLDLASMGSWTRPATPDAEAAPTPAGHFARPAASGVSPPRQPPSAVGPNWRPNTFNNAAGVGMPHSASLPSNLGHLDDDNAGDIEILSARESKILPMASRPWQKIAGQLDVKILDAHELLLPTEGKMSLEYYALVICESHSGQQTHQTEVQRDSMGNPVWDEAITFHDVAMTDMLIIRLFEHRKFRVGDACLGQAMVPVMDFLDCKPHYLWLTLERRSTKDRPPQGQIHIRFQLRSDEQYQHMPGVQNFQASLQGIGIMMVEASALKSSRELMHCLLEEVNIDFRRSKHEESVRMSIHTLQVDNQLLSSQHPVVLSSQLDVEPGDDGCHHIRRPAFEITWVRSLTDPSMLYMQYFTVLLQEMNLVLEEDFLDILISWALNLPVDELWSTASRQGVMATDGTQEVHSSDAYGQYRDGGSMALCGSDQLMKSIFTELGGAAAKRLSGLAAQSPLGPSRGKWYFEVLHIQPLKINLSILPGEGLMQNDVTMNIRKASHLGMRLVNINSVPLRINQLALKNAFVRPDALVDQIARHMAYNMLSELYKVLGNVELVGAPVSLISTLGTGVVDFFYEPAKGIVHGPDEFARGMASGTVSLLKNSAYGIFHTVGQVTGGVSKGLAVLSMDRHYLKRFKRRPVSVQEGIRQGAQDLGVGLYEGVTGIVTDPLRGAESSGMRGFFKGLATGLTGVVVKPTAGMLEFASKTVSGIGGGIKAWGDEVGHGAQQKQRVRSPQNSGLNPSLGDGLRRELDEWQALVSKAPSADGRFNEDRVHDFVLIKPDRALVLTDRRILYFNLITRRCLWDMKIANLTNIQPDNLSVHFTSRERPKMFGKKPGSWLTLPVRRTVVCLSQDTQQALMLKLTACQAQHNKMKSEASLLRGKSHEANSRLLATGGLPSAAPGDVPTQLDDFSLGDTNENPEFARVESLSVEQPAFSFSSLRLSGKSVDESWPSFHSRTKEAIQTPKPTVCCNVPEVNTATTGTPSPSPLKKQAATNRTESIEHVVSLGMLVKLAQSSLLRPEAMHSHLLAVAALCAVLQGDFASDDVVAAALVTSMKSICDTASPSTLTNAHGIEVLLNTLAQLHQSLEQLLGRAGRQ